jgi:acyl-CoA hydrolase
MKYKIKQYTTHHLIKSEDLNHHKTLFFGRALEWFAESAFVAVAQLLPPESLVGLQVESLTFKKSARSGEVICFNSRVIFAGKSTLIVYVRVNGKSNEDECSNILVDGFATFVHVDENTKPFPHNIEIEPVTEEDVMLIEKYHKFKEKK